MHTFFDLIPLSTVLNICLLIAYIAIVSRVTSYTVVIAGVILIEFLHQGLYSYLSQPTAQDYIGKWIYFAWYLGFGLTDLVFVLSVIACCRQLNISIQMISKTILVIFTFLGLLQIARFIEKQYSGTDLLKLLYTQGIPAFNYLIVALLFGQLVVEVANKVNQTKNGID